MKVHIPHSSDHMKVHTVKFYWQDWDNHGYNQLALIIKKTKQQH
jgi:hypothetical protein